jgi:two-component system nitrogen regulation sensor histidine kinase NtrY
VISIKRQIFLIQNLVNEFSSYARLPKPKIVKLNISDIANIYIEEYKKNYSNIIFNSKIENNIVHNFDQSYIDIIFNNLFKNSIEALKDIKNPQIELLLSINNGPGYEGDVGDLLKPYFSTKNSSGLGLSLISKIVNENNGDLFIKTNKYSGFKVEICFNV